jgi:glycerophosphoryl diester phosphodiesterase
MRQKQKPGGTSYATKKLWRKYPMARIKIRSGKSDIMVIGHRGAAGYAPENTMPAFQKGYELGADWLETEVGNKKSVDTFS